MSHLEEFKIVSDIQLGFRKSHSCETQLRITLEYLVNNLDHSKQSDINLLGFFFAKAFDTVPHQHLLLKLSHYGVQGTGHNQQVDSSLGGEVSTETLGKFFLFSSRSFLR